MTKQAVKLAPVEILVLRFRVDSVERRSERQWTGGAGAEAQFADVDLGWFARSGRLCFALGDSPCDWRVGDMLELRKVQR